jgi:hypothetical protein
MPISTIGSNSLNQTSDLTINGVTVGKGTNSVSNNTAVGASALAGANSGTGNNTAVGYQASYSNTTGYANVSIGYQAGKAITTGVGNVCMGYLAGYTNISSNNTTYIGNQAGANTTGEYNTCIGFASGSSITTGTKNVILGGYNGNNLGLDIRTLSNNIVLSNGDGSPYFWIDSYGNNHIGLPGNGTNPPVYNNGGDPAATVGVMSAMPSTVSRINIQERADKWVTWVDGGGTNYGVISRNGAGVTYGSNSDYRLKENVTPLTGALERVTNLKPVKFKWIIDGTLSEGFIAHEVQEIIPLAVKGEKDGMADDNSGRPLHQTLDASIIIPTLTAAIKELKTIVDAQAAEIAELKAKVA